MMNITAMRVAKFSSVNLNINKKKCTLESVDLRTSNFYRFKNPQIAAVLFGIN